MRLRVATRLLDIQRVLVRHGLDEFILATHLFRSNLLAGGARFEVSLPI